MKFRLNPNTKIKIGKTYLANRSRVFGSREGTFTVIPTRFYEKTEYLNQRNIWECSVIDGPPHLRGGGWWFLEKDFIREVK